MSGPKYTLEYCNSLPKFNRSVSLLSWAYNEEGLIYDFLIRVNDILRKSVEDYEIVIIDDCSTDRTNESIRTLQKKIPEIKLTRNPVNMGVGFSCCKAIQNATKDYLFWQTVDWSYDIKYLRIFLELLKSYDIVQGVRREPIRNVDERWRGIVALTRLFGMKHLTKRSDTIFKAIVSVINYLLIRILFRIPISDFQNITFYPTKLIQSIKFESCSSFLNPEGMIKTYWKKVSLIEVPISFIPRNTGIAKGVSIKTIKAAVTDIIKLWLRWVVLKKRDFRGYGSITRLIPEEWELNLNRNDG